MTTSAFTDLALPETALELYRAPSHILRDVMERGEAPPFEDLVGWEFNGLNIGALAGPLGLRKFRKGFYQGPARADSGPRPFIQGFNIPVAQNGVGAAHRAKPDDDHPKRFGFYRVYRASANPRYGRFPNALMLDYGLGANGPTPPALLRDYLVQVHRGASELLLGCAYVDLGLFRFPVGYFVLERARPHTFTGEAPHRS